jgi:hypothetical protein
MSILPAFILFINGDITYPAEPPPTPPTYIGAQWPQISELTHIQTQLFIDDTMTKQEFDARLIADPNYGTVIHLHGLRILVIVPSFEDMVNREWADIVGFLHKGLIDIEFNRCGDLFKSFDIQRISPNQLLHATHGPGEVVVPFGACGSECGMCQYPFYCDTEHTFSGIKICNSCGNECKCGCNLYTKQGVKVSPIHLPNCENEAHNQAFIHRK